MIYSCGNKVDLIKGLAKYLFSEPENFKLLDKGEILQYRRDKNDWIKSQFIWGKKGKRYFVK